MRGKNNLSQNIRCEPHVSKIIGVPKNTDKLTTVKFLLLLSILSNLVKLFILEKGWSGGAMVLGKLPVPGRPTIWISVGQGPTALVVGAGGFFLDIFTLIYPFSPLSPSLWGRPDID